MSWGFTYAGKASAVSAKVERDAGAYCPQAIKDAVKGIAEQVPDDKVLYVESNGHTEVRQPTYPPGSAPDPTDVGKIVWGSGELKFKVLPRAEDVG